MASVPLRIRWSDIHCVPSRHQHNAERRNEVQVQDETSRRDHMLEACYPLWLLWICEDMPKIEALPYWSMGTN